MFRYILIVATLIIAACAAFFSVTGIGRLFAGAAIPVMVMASALELGKLVTVSYLYRYWKETARTLKTYLVLASVSLMVITSMGIYGYLTSAYASVASVPQTELNQMNLIDAQNRSIGLQIANADTEIANYTRSRQQTQATLDAVVGKTTYGNNRTTQSAQRQIDVFNQRIGTLETHRSQLTHQSDSLTIERTRLQNSVTTDAKIGTFFYVARALGTSLDNVVKWFTLLLVLVFDPLSVSLVLAYNTMIKKNRGSEPVEEDQMEPMHPSAPLNEASIQLGNSILAARVPESAIRRDEEPTSTIPYYLDPNYDWDHDVRWHADPQAAEFRKNKR